MEKGRAPTNISSKGFTIVELLIVIVVIGILAAITIVAYNGIQTKSKIAAVQSDINNATKLVENYRFSGSNPGELYPATASLVTLPTSISYTAYNSQRGYCIQSTNGTVTYYTTAGGSAKEGACQTVTNYAKRPYPNGDASVWTGYNVAGGHTLGLTPMGTAPNGKDTYRFTAGAAGFSALMTIGLEYQGTAIALPAGASISPSIYVRSSKAGTYRLLHQYYNGTTSVTDQYGANTTVPANTWVRLIASPANLTVPSPADRMSIRAQYTSGTTWAQNDWIEVTQVSTAAGEYVDPDNQNWSWTGAANVSTSTGPAL